jgi:H+-translocating NAD(P) transhydrogenase subunit alpha
METTAVTIGILRELRHGERRVAMMPADIRRLARRAIIYVERGAGALAGVMDQDYIAAGARVAPVGEVTSAADVIASIRAPESIEALRPNTVLISLGGSDARATEMLKARSVTHFALERLPRTTRAQSMDVLSSQASVAGYAAVLEGARRLNVFLPMMVTAAGTAKPAKMIAIGAGVAGLQAIATARRLGAQAYGFDVREAAREQVESLGARFISLEQSSTSGEGAGGYAADQTANEQQAIRTALAQHLSQMQLIVTSAQIPGRPAPVLIDETTAKALQPGSVIVDLAAETGGNTVFTRPDEIVSVAGVHILGPTNLPSAVAADASRFFSSNLRALLEHILDQDGHLVLDERDAIVSALLAGQVPTRSARAFA